MNLPPESPDAESPLLRVFLRALELQDPDQRRAYLDSACGSDAAMRARVEALLEGHGKGSFLERPAAGLMHQGPTLESAGSDRAEGWIGRYKLLQKIGEGGMGLVYMAEQEEPVRRRVALKVIKLGMDTRQVIARFEAERQALAMMDHPNIARVLDAGATETGRPYFVMELVRGIRITDYCDQNHLSMRARLDLFIPVCQAIQHAHQKGIIHRDIKPSNILITLHDGVPVPKVIDFGIAKATEGRLTDKTLFTAFEQFIGTPAYMSPEQAEMSGLDVDTRSDIYSLGVLLYELLTGKTPFDANDLMLAGLDSMRRTIREQEPPRPSTRLNTMLAGELTTTASRRSSDSRRLIDLLQGDLDWIVMKCLEKDRTRRYESAAGLAIEIQRHLNQEPVAARPPSTTYRLGKFIRRNKLVCGAGLAVFLALVVGSVVTAWQAIRARQAERVAVEQSKLATQLQLVAQGEARRAENQRERAEKLAMESRGRLLRLTVGNGVRVLNQTNYVESLLWFAKAVELSEGDPVLEKAARLRYASVLQQCPRLLQIFSHTPTDPVLFCAFSRDGRRVLTTSWDHSARVWDTTTGEMAGPPLKHERGGVLYSSFSPDGGRVVTAGGGLSSGKSFARVWDVVTGRELTPALTHSGMVVCARFSPDGRRILTSSLDGTAGVWDSVTGERALPPLKHDGALTSAIFSADGRLILTASMDHTARVWDATTGRERIPAVRHELGVTCVEFSPDGGRFLTASDDSTVRLWDVQTGEPIGQPMRHGGTVFCASFSPDGARIVAGCVDDRTARIWDARTQAPIPSAIPYHISGGIYPHIPVFSPNGRWIATTDGDRSAALWDAGTLLPVGPSLRHNMQVHDGAFSPEGGRLITTSSDSTARLWDLTDAPTPLAPLHEQRLINRAVRSRDGRRVVLAVTNHAAQVFDALTGAPITAPLPHSGSVLVSRFSPDGELVATGSMDKTARVWNVRTGQAVTPPIPHKMRVNLAAFSPDGGRLATACRDGTARVWDALTGAALTPQLEHCPGQDALIGFMAFSLDGRWLVTGGGDNTARVWDAGTGLPISPYLRHDGPVVHAAFSPDLRMLATAGCDGTARLWDLATGDPLLVPLQHHHTVLRVDFTSDGRRLLTQSTDGIWLWDLPTDERPAAELARLAQCLAGSEVDQGGSLTAMSAEKVRGAWQALRGRYPDQDLLPHRVLPRGLSSASPELREVAPQTDWGASWLEDPGHSPRGAVTPVDLSGHINASLDVDWLWATPGDDLSSMPRGRQKFGGTEFDVRGVVQVGSAQIKAYSKTVRPEAIRGIMVQRKARYLHFLHAAGGHIALGGYCVHYRSGRTWELPVAGDLDGLELRFRGDESSETQRAVLAWSGSNGSWKLRVYKWTWENPFPDDEIESIDVVSGMDWVTLSLFGISVE